MQIKVRTNTLEDEIVTFPFLWMSNDGDNIYYCYENGSSVRLGSKAIDTTSVNYCWAGRLARGTIVTLTVE